jgi:hypothetical protein
LWVGGAGVVIVEVCVAMLAYVSAPNQCTDIRCLGGKGLAWEECTVLLEPFIELEDSKSAYLPRRRCTSPLVWSPDRV